MAAPASRTRLSLLAVSSLAAVGGGLAATPAAQASTGTQGGLTLSSSLSGSGATIDANGNLTVTGAAVPYTVTISYTATAYVANVSDTVQSVVVMCGGGPSGPAAQVVKPLDPATGKGVDSCTYPQAGLYQVVATAHDSMNSYASTNNNASINQPPPPPPASKAPTVQLGLATAQGTADANGDIAVAIPHAGPAQVSANYSAKAFQPTPSGIGIASATMNCGHPGETPTQLPVSDPTTQYGGIGGYSSCAYSQPGTYTITFTATDNQRLNYTGNNPMTSTVTHTVTVAPGTPIAVDRYDGASRYGTGVAVSQAAFPTAGSANAVVLARGDVFADALAGIPLAKAKNGPLLLTPGGVGVTGMDPNIAAELARVLPKDKNHTVYLLGGVGALPLPIENQVAGLGYNVVRLAGASRFDTALAIAQDPRALNNPGNIVVARGDDFADALAAGPFAANVAKDAAGSPAAIVLSDGPTATAHLDPNSAAYVAAKLANASFTVTAIGGGAQTAVGHLAGSASKVKSIVGGDRFLTAYLVAKQGWAIDNGISPVFSAATMGVATGTAFPDALTGGAYMALKNGPLLLTAPPGLTGAAAMPLQFGLNALNDVAIFGGTGVLGQGAVDTTLTTVKSPASVYHDHHEVF